MSNPGTTATVSFTDCEVRLSDTYALTGLNFVIEPGQGWLLFGANGSGKSALAAAIAGEGEVARGQRVCPKQARLVSFEAQRALVEAERRADESDITDEVSIGTTVRTLLEDCDQVALQPFLTSFKLEDKLDRGFRQLSTGETRKVLLAQALYSGAELIVLDEPYEGLDAESCETLTQLLEDAATNKTLVLVVNRLSEVPTWITHACLLVGGELVSSGPADMESIRQFMQLHSQAAEIPRAEHADRVPALPPGPLIRIREGRVAYGDEVIFSGLDWQVNPQEHWQVVGPNGSGKTCLLNLISGDHPQCYVNDIFVVGYQRGQGESIWDLKQHMGYVSSQLQIEYRVSINLLNVILSGFYDSIGLYEKASDDQVQVAKAWLELLGLGGRADQPFNQCSYGDQKMLLIARAMVKHPQLLILDEPCLGLDEMNRQLVLALIDKICRSGETTVLYVNHHAEDRIPSIERVLDMADYR